MPRAGSLGGEAPTRQRGPRSHAFPAGMRYGWRFRPRSARPMQQTENLNVAALDVMPSPDEVKARVPLDEPAARTVVEGRRTLEAILDGRDPRLFVVVGPVLDPRPGRRARLRAPPARARGRGRADALPRDARLLREAAHLDRLEGVHQRPAHGRLLPHRRGDGAGAPLPARRERARAARRDRGARPHRAAVLRRPHRLDRDRRAHLRVADAPRDVVRPLDPGRLQERHRRRRRRAR